MQRRRWGAVSDGVDNYRCLAPDAPALLLPRPLIIPFLVILLVQPFHPSVRGVAFDAAGISHNADAGSSSRASGSTAGARATLADTSINFTSTAAGRASGATMTTAATSSSPNQAIQIVIVNDIAGHFEVLAGVLVSLHRMLKQQDQHQDQQHDQPRLALKPRVVYTGNTRAPIDNGLNDWLGKGVTGAFAWHPFNPTGAAIVVVGGAVQQQQQAGWPAPADVVICVSAELAPKVCKAVLMAVQPQLLVVVVHRADTHSANARILSLYPTFKLMALAPHVANLSSRMLRRSVDWSMPVAAFVPRKTCATKECLKGFSIQGALRRYKSKHGNGFTRDYAGLWRRLLQLRAEGQPVPPVVVVGKGERADLQLPPELENRVAFHPWLRYPDFWSLIHHSYALVPAFGMPVYYESRISSTILASLLTCVPVIAEQLLLDTYTFLDERHVFLRQPGEDEAAAMVRIMGLPEEELFARRTALCELQLAMNAQADGLMSGYLRQAVAMGAAAGS